MQLEIRQHAMQASGHAKLDGSESSAYVQSRQTLSHKQVGQTTGMAPQLERCGSVLPLTWTFGV